MPELRVRWSESEARKPYARPFMVTFAGGDGDSVGSIAVNGADLLYYHQFQGAVLTLCGELFADPEAEASADPQRLWLDRLATLLPALAEVRVTPHSLFDERQGRQFRCTVRGEVGPTATVEAQALLEYQEFQAVLAHQTGCLFRDAQVEAVEDPQARRGAWMHRLQRVVARPDASEAMSAAWPWR